MNEMFVWMDEKRAGYQREYPHLDATELTRHMAQAWNKLSSEKKVPGTSRCSCSHVVSWVLSSV